MFDILLSMNTKNLFTFFVLLLALLGIPLITTAQFSFDPPAPNWSIDFEWDGGVITENGLYEFALNQEKVSSYTWTTGAQGQIYGEIYKGELNNATLSTTHLFDSSGIATTTDIWLSEGNYFVVVYNLNTSCGNIGDICFLSKIDDIQEWFENGFSSSNFFSNTPSSPQQLAAQCFIWCNSSALLFKYTSTGWFSVAQSQPLSLYT